MPLLELICTAVLAIATNKLRSSLTLLGIVIGIFSITAIMTAVGILQQTVESNLNIFGRNTFYIHRYPAVTISGEGMEALTNRAPLDLRTFRQLRCRLRIADHVVAEISEGGITAAFAGKVTKPRLTVSGVTGDWLQTSGYQLARGRMFSNAEIRRARYVALVGQGVITRLMPHGDPLGKTIRVHDHPCKIVGVLAKKGTVFGESRDDIIVVPLSAYCQAYTGPEIDLAISVGVSHPDKYGKAMGEATAVLRRIRGVPLDAPDDFEMTSNQSLIDQFNDITRNLKLAALIIGSIALVAAGIGIMNIMLVSITERTREIGIRKSLGATRGSILAQFLMEAVLLTEIGGVMGMGMGITAVNIAAVYLNVPVVLSVRWMVMGLALCSAIGVLFGTYPAYKAAGLNPIEAMQHR